MTTRPFTLVPSALNTLGAPGPHLNGAGWAHHHQPPCLRTDPRGARAGAPRLRGEEHGHAQSAPVPVPVGWQRALSRAAGPCRALGLQLAPLPRYLFSPPIPQFQAALEQKPFSLVVGGARLRQVPFLALPVGSGVRA